MRSASRTVVWLVLLTGLLTDSVCAQFVDQREHWQRQLTHSRARLRAQAALELSRLGPAAKDAVHALIPCLEDSDSQVRLNAIQALGYIGTQAQLSINRIVPLLEDSDEHVRYAAEWCLARFALQPVRLSEAVERRVAFNNALELIDRREHNLRHREILMTAIAEIDHLLSSQQEPSAPVELQLSDESETPALAREPEIVDPRLTELESSFAAFEVGSTFERLAIIQWIGQAFDGRLAKPAEKARQSILRAAASSGDVTVFDYAISTWAELGRAAHRSLVMAITPDSSESSARTVVSRWTPIDVADVQCLVSIVESPLMPRSVRLAAIESLGRTTLTEDPLAQISLADFASDKAKDDSIRIQALQTLAQTCPEMAADHRVEDRLLEMLHDVALPWSIRIHAAEAVVRLLPSSATTIDQLALMCVEKDLSLIELREVLHILELSTAEVNKCNYAIQLGLESKEGEARVSAIRLAGRVGATNAYLVESLFECFLAEPSDPTQLYYASEALLDIGGASLDEFGRLLLRMPAEARLHALRALAAHGPKARPFKLLFLHILGDRDEPNSVRCAAIAALGAIEDPDTETVQQLLAFLQETDEPAGRAVAITALSQMSACDPNLLEVRVQDADHLGFAAAYELAQEHAGDKDAVFRLVRLLEWDEDEYVSQAILDLGSRSIKALLAAVTDRKLNKVARMRGLACLKEVLVLDATGAIAQAERDQVQTALVDIVGDDEIGLATMQLVVDTAQLCEPLEVLDKALTRLAESDESEVQFRYEMLIDQLGRSKTALPPTVDATVQHVRPASFLSDRLQHDMQWDLFVTTAAPAARIASDQGAAPLTSPAKPLPIDGSKSTRIQAEAGKPENQRETSATSRGPPAPINGSLADTMSTSTEEEEPSDTRPQPLALAAEALHSLAGDDKDQLDPSTVTVFYATNRSVAEEPFPVEAAASLSRDTVYKIAACILACLIIAIWGLGLIKQRAMQLTATAIAGVSVAGIAVGFNLTAGSDDTLASDVTYSTSLSTDLSLGVCEVSIPATHVPGELESESIFRFEFKEDPDKHIVLSRTLRLSPSDFDQRLQQRLDSDGNNLLVFIHGYNVSFEDAARRTAQLAYDIDFPGAPLFYSWPSQSNWYEYQKDKKNIQLSVPHIKGFLLRLAATSGADSIHVIAHSMGNVGLTDALADIDASTPPLLNQVVLAAPDIDADLFRNQIAPRIVGKAQQFTLYASDHDLALKASRYFNAGIRAGETAANLEIPGIKIIDATGLDTSLFGHTYYGGSSVLNELRQLVHAVPFSAESDAMRTAQGEDSRGPLESLPATR